MQLFTAFLTSDGVDEGLYHSCFSYGSGLFVKFGEIDLASPEGCGGGSTACESTKKQNVLQTQLLQVLRRVCAVQTFPLPGFTRNMPRQQQDVTSQPLKRKLTFRWI
ncbi:hypothetical protein JTB14_013239 [Gonioctena quinquepunctata]|nr:hypothetical protein JTB14_013239 [Gonioctena quinquepunctata]